MYVIAISNMKGGVAKTLTSVNLAGILSSRGYKTLLIDMDTQCNLTTFFERYTENKLKNINQVLCHGMDIADAIVPTNFKNLDIVPSHINLGFASYDLQRLHVGRETVLKKKLVTIKDKYDFVILDCPPTIDTVVTNAITASNCIVTPCEAISFAFDSIDAISKIVNDVRNDGINPDVFIAGLLITKREKTVVQNLYAESLTQIDGLSMFKTEIRKATVVQQSENGHAPLIYYAPDEPVTKDYINFCDELMEIIQAKSKLKESENNG